MVVRRSVGVCLVLLGIHAISSAHAGDDAAPPAAQSGMQAHVDPATGRLVPEPVSPPLARPAPPAPPLVAEPAPGGGMVVHLNGQFMSTAVATVESDGSVHVDCVTGDGPTVHAGE
jgi:hypothetical protein